MTVSGVPIWVPFGRKPRGQYGHSCNEGAWTQQGEKLASSGATGSRSQGMSVALSADGNVAMVGGLTGEAARAPQRCLPCMAPFGPKARNSSALALSESFHLPLRVSADSSVALVVDRTR